MKKLIIFILILVGLFYGLQFGAGKVAVVAIEQMGSRSTGGTVTVEDVSISVIEGKVDIKGLNLSGMDGLGADDSVAIKDISVTVDRESLGGDVLAVKDLIVEGADLNYALPNGIAGLAPMLAKIKQGGGAMPKGLPGGSGGGGGGPQMNVDNLQVSGGAVNIQVGDQTFSSPMPSINMQNLGGSGGAGAGAIAQQVMGQIMANSSNAMAGLDIGALTKAAAAQGMGSGGMGGQMDAAKKAINSLSGDAANTLKQLMNK